MFLPIDLIVSLTCLQPLLLTFRSHARMKTHLSLMLLFALVLLSSALGMVTNSDGVDLIKEFEGWVRPSVSL